MHGYSATILRVDLSTGECSRETCDDRFARAWLGGNGFAAKLIDDAVPADADAFDEANAIVFAVGPVTDTPVWGSSRGHVAAVSPLTGLFADSNFGGDFAVAQKRTGFDAVVITGVAKRPVYLLVTEGGAEIKDASDLWGRMTDETNRALAGSEGPNAVAASIGPAGENHVLFANIICDGRRPGAAGRGGLGAGMGSKKLKAVVARGGRRTEIARPDPLKALLDERREALREGTEKLSTWGTPFLVDMINDRGLLCTHNASRETCEFASDINASVLKSRYIEKSIGCHGCPVACGKTVRVPSGGYAGRTLKMPEYETIYALGSMLDVRDMTALVNANGACDRYGLDTISMGVTLAFVAECMEQDLVDELRMGWDVLFDFADGLTPHVVATALRDGIGDMLALGSERLADRIGPESRKLLYTVKGLEIAGHSARGLRPMALGYATSTRGGSHHDTRPKYLVPDTDPGFAGQAEYNMHSQNFTAVGDSLVMCRFTHERGLGAQNGDALSAVLNAVTGWDVDAAELERIGERVYNLERLINCRRGVTRKDDTLPWRTMNEPIPDGPARGRVCAESDLQGMLDEYYALRGWSPDGVPTDETLRALGLDDFNDT